MIFKTRKLVKSEDLNSNGTLFGGRLLEWIDEEAAIFAMCQLDSDRVVTKIISDIDFVSPAYLGDVIEIGVDVNSIGRTSITLKIEIRNKKTKKSILNIEKIVFVNMGLDGKPVVHGKKLKNK